MIQAQIQNAVEKYEEAAVLSSSKYTGAPEDSRNGLSYQSTVFLSNQQVKALPSEQNNQELIDRIMLHQY